MDLIQSPELPAPAGHYPQAVAAGGLGFVSGILPSPASSDPATASCWAEPGLLHE
jgi:enamine deaminase RidA (YjgF/YER057c/UK114 family)